MDLRQVCDRRNHPFIIFETVQYFFVTLENTLRSKVDLKIEQSSNLHTNLKFHTHKN